LYQAVDNAAPYFNYMRQVPDVAAAADLQYVQYIYDSKTQTSGWGMRNGTSFATPLWAAGILLVNQSIATQGGSSRLGFLNPPLYDPPAPFVSGSFLHDITTGGDNCVDPDSPCNASTPHKYPVTPGYDLVTGLGSPDFGKIATALLGKGVIVSDTSDTIHAPGCSATGTGLCSLRDAILFANTKTSAQTTTITLPAGTYTLTIPGRNETNALTGDLNIKANIAITGAGAASTIVQASATDSSTGIDCVFSIAGLWNVTITGITIRYGNCSHDGGGISYSGSQTGGGSLRISESIIADNTTALPYGSGGGIADSGHDPVVLYHSAVSGNRAAYGGGITASTNFSITASTISGNSAANFGGGIFAGNVGWRVLISNSTISGNSAPAGSGGGIHAVGVGLVDISDSTIAMNSTNLVTTLPMPVTPVSIRTVRSIVASSTSGLNCSGNIVSGGYNLDSGSSCGFAQATDLSSANPLLAPLALNAPGTTPTHALQAGSPAIDHGGTSATGCPATDQRGIPRPQRAACDIGAYEADNILPAPAARSVPVAPPIQPVNPAPVARDNPPVGTAVSPVPVPASRP
jgi:hypothetical protein